MTTLTIDQKIAGLRRAQQLLRERGWCQGSFSQPDGEVCANGALNLAFGGTGNPYSSFIDMDLLEDVAHDLPPATRPCMDAVSRICDFNNEEARSVEDVIAQFQITIDRLERERLPREDRELVAV